MPGREALVGRRPVDVAGASEEVEAPCRQRCVPSGIVASTTSLVPAADRYTSFQPDRSAAAVPVFTISTNLVRRGAGDAGHRTRSRSGRHRHRRRLTRTRSSHALRRRTRCRSFPRRRCTSGLPGRRTSRGPDPEVREALRTWRPDESRWTRKVPLCPAGPVAPGGPAGPVLFQPSSRSSFGSRTARRRRGAARSDVSARVNR